MLILAIEGAFKKGKEIMVSLKDIVINRSIDYGFIFVLISIMKRLRIDEALEKILGDRANLVKLMIIGKIVTRGSKLCIYNWINRNKEIAKIFPWLKQNNNVKKEKLSLRDIEEELKMIKLNVLKIGKNHEEIMITELTNRQKEILNILNIDKKYLEE